MRVITAPADEVVEAKKSFYVPQLDALRFIAFFAVFIHHNIGHTSDLSPGLMAALFRNVRSACACGLSLFFFLSSYLITTLLVKEKERSGTIAVRSFFMRRVLRIWPLYFLFLGVIAVVGFWYLPFRIDGWRFVAMSALAANWYWAAYGPGGGVIYHLWSISVEEQFYLVWPWFFRGIGKKTLFYGAIAAAVLSLLATAAMVKAGADSDKIWFSTISEGVFFAGGAILALKLPEIRRTYPALSPLLLVSGFGLWMAAEAVGNLKGRAAELHPGSATMAYLLVAIGCGAMLVGALWFSAQRVPKWLIYLGKISYGLYVFHLLGALIADNIGLSKGRFFAALLITIAMASLSYQWIEKPFLRMKSRFEVVRTR